VRNPGELVLTKFTISGTDDEARAALKANLDAQDAAFQARLDAMFKSPPPPANVTEVPAKEPVRGSLTLARPR
jgi:hypothetical protein